MTIQKESAVIFGGTGFIGIHFARMLVAELGFQRVVLVDIKPPHEHIAHRFIQPFLDDGRVAYVRGDVRNPIEAATILGGERADVIANFAAIHREPGHEMHEYFETNLPGARNVCGYAAATGCERIIFTSSISPYGPSEIAKDEGAIPTPETAYGSSKLAAEIIHEAWHAGAPSKRQLLVVRPGVVFGPGEGGNVSRLVGALTRGFFVYAGNEQTRKAGIYVKELGWAMWWLFERMAAQGPGLLTANMSMNPGPSMKEYVDTVQLVAGKRAWVPSIPVWLLLATARLVQSTLGAMGMMRSINVVRVRKIIRSNNIVPGVLVAVGYPYRYTLQTALADWRQDLPEEWRAQ